MQHEARLVQHGIVHHRFSFMKLLQHNSISLYIPTIFCSYTGEALIRHRFFVPWKQLSTQAMRIIKLFGDTTATKVVTSVGLEQEYFVGADTYDKRKDSSDLHRPHIIRCNRSCKELMIITLVIIKERVLALYMMS